MRSQFESPHVAMVVARERAWFECLPPQISRCLAAAAPKAGTRGA